VTVEILHCDGGLKHAGYRAAATVKVNGLKDRAAGCADVRLVVDGNGWVKWDRKRRQSVLDHELFHLTVRYHESGEVIRDDLGRPKLKMRLHDHQIGVFEEVIRRNKEHAVDAQVVARAWASMKQLEIDWTAAELMDRAVDDGVDTAE
jgi:hypothetical protein